MARVLFLINPATLQILSTKDYLYSFELFSNHDVSYLPEVPHVWKSFASKADFRPEQEYVDLFSNFDVVVITQHLRLCFDGWINANLHNALLKFNGVKVVFLQDEYDHTEKARVWIEEQAVDLVYTVVPEPHVSKVYNPSRFPKTQFRSVLTGYSPLKFRSQNYVLPIAERKKLLVYRGRVSPASYGALAKQKELIGRFFDSYCDEKNIEIDIQWEEAERVYGLDWYSLLETGVATLGTESGSNVFDEFGLIREHVSKGQHLPGPEHLNFFEENLGFKMNQVSPKIFEAIGCGTGLVLYEGEYSGVIESGEHFLALKHDNSNADEVVEQLKDSAYIQKMVDRTRNHIASCKHYHYQYLVELFDKDITSHVTVGSKVPSCETKVSSSRLPVGDFSDSLATGVGVYSGLHQDLLKSGFSNEIKISVSKKVSKYPRLKMFLKRAYFKIRSVYRVVPNRFPILGRIKRRILAKLSS